MLVRLRHLDRLRPVQRRPKETILFLLIVQNILSNFCLRLVYHLERVSMLLSHRAE